MVEPENLAAPEIQRRMWRRVWFGLAIFVIVTPVLLWVAVDQAGKREWERVQAELRAKGEAITIAELNLPTSGEIPDEENFGAVKWLRAHDDGTESEAMMELDALLDVFVNYQRDREVMLRAEGNAPLGLASDPETRLSVFDDAAIELGIDRPKSADGDTILLLSSYLELWSEPWDDLRNAVDREHAHTLPLLSQRLEDAEIPMGVSMPVLGQFTGITRALKWQALVAMHQRDADTFQQCIEVGGRLIDLATGERHLIGNLVASTCSAQMQNVFMEALWNEEMVDALGPDRLQECQSVFERTDLKENLQQSMRSELVYLTGSLAVAHQHRDDLWNDYGGDEFYSALLLAAPRGWFLNSAAYGAELFDRHLFESFRRDANPGEVLAAADRMVVEVKSLGTVERINYALVVMSIPAYSKLFRRVAYTETRRRQAILVCALHRYRLENGGAFPESLDALVPVYLDSVLADPMDGKPMRYSLTDEPGGFRLWSIGFDGTDDDGELNLPVDEPERTRLDRDTYIGDWPWPTAPRKFNSSDAGDTQNEPPRRRIVLPSRP